MSVAEELATRGGLNSALAGRDALGLVPLVSFLRKHVTEPRYTKLLVSMSHRVLDIFGGSVGEDKEVDKALKGLRERVHVEAKMQQELMELQGFLEPLIVSGLRLAFKS